MHDNHVEWLRAAGRRRLFPPITDPNWLVLRARRKHFSRWLNQLPLQSANVLDVGGRLQPYRELLPKSCRYWSVDLRPTALLSAVADAASLPFHESAFQLVICTQMLEYAPCPQQVINEIHRVLAPGGTLLLSAPSIFPRDSEYDRWRFFPAAYRSLMSQFPDLEILPEGSTVAGFMRTTAVFARTSARYNALRLVLDLTLVPVLNVLGALGDKTLGAGDGTFTVNYSVRARK
jgi:SAM-dependent methyltransferase